MATNAVTNCFIEGIRSLKKNFDKIQFILFFNSVKNYFQLIVFDFILILHFLPHNSRQS